MKYTKVIIKSKNDLPKETGGYFVFDKAFSFQSDYFNNDDKSKERWLKNFRWYLIEDTEQYHKSRIREVIESWLNYFYDGDVDDFTKRHLDEYLSKHNS